MILKLLAAALEVLGTFFLAVEAIKLPNLQRLRERYLLRPYLWTNPIARSLQAKHTGQELSNSYVGALVLLGAIAVSVAASIEGVHPSAAWEWYRSVVPWPLLVAAIAAIPVLLVLVFFLSLVGSFIIQAFAFPIVLAILLLEYVEKHTASGLIGILGFLLFLAGTLLRLWLEGVGG